ncbi:MAG TPA: S8 family peptidase [Pyrinomonadaceae bacterium]|nr:S8 family peptidase [Pyrinomonadaceae bacterium]
MPKYKHILLADNKVSERFTPPSGRGEARLSVRDRALHSQRLLQKFEQIWAEKERVNETRTAEGLATREGTYLEFISAAGYDLITKSLEDRRSGIRLLNIKQEGDAEQSQVKATVYVPNGKEGYFVKKIQAYQNQDTPKGNPKNAPLVSSIEDVSMALLESLWTDHQKFIPTDQAKWCETWLRVDTENNNEQEEIGRFLERADQLQIEHKDNSIVFPERAVLLINASREQLVQLMLSSDLIAEFRVGQEAAGFWMKETAINQEGWVDDLLKRLDVDAESKIKLCLLDTGVNNGHRLLSPVLANTDMLTVDPNWGTDDHYQNPGHGTLVAGIAAYGNLEKVLATTDRISAHVLCSVKMLPRPEQEPTPKELWGDVTSQAVSRAEIQNPGHRLIYCMSVTAPEDLDKGRPSSWSGAVDNLSYGDGTEQRLVLVSGGNMAQDFFPNYPDSNFTSSVHNPAQSWNALTIGAYTEKTTVNDPVFVAHVTLAGANELSPHSTTSRIWERKWPVKPDVVFEGGNWLKAPDGQLINHDDLDLLSTSKNFRLRSFDTTNATSAAVAQAAWFAGNVLSNYPDFWPETIRALMVHSAEWKSEMLAQCEMNGGSGAEYRNLLRTFGYGKPDLDKAIYSVENSMTYIAQEVIQPYIQEEGKSPATNEVHIFTLPWPADQLIELADTSVKLKVTLSYFIEPGAGEIGWKDKYRYQSYGLRFEVNKSGETEDEFRKRINKAAREDGEDLQANSGFPWVIGKGNINRTTGSIHSDFWEGTAANLATSNTFAVYPIIGWWRERHHLGKVENRTRYSLVISLETPAEDVELYSAVQAIIGTPIPIST